MIRPECFRAGAVLLVLTWATSSLAARTADTAPSTLAPDRLRLIIETDAGGDPDDEQSLVRFLLYSNEWDGEGIIANRPQARQGENRNVERTGLGIVRAQLRAYGECQPRLAKHDARYPTVQYLMERTVAGYDDTDDGVKLIIAAVDRPDPRPVWFINWGTDNGSAESSLKRALDRIRAERVPEGYAKFKDRLRLSGDDKFGEHTWAIAPPFKIWVDTLRPEQKGKRWYHQFSPLTSKAGGFDLERDVRHGHGPLGALYPTNTNRPQKEGDTMMFLYLLPTGMNDPNEPTWGSWAGRYVLQDNAEGRNYYWANGVDEWQGTTHRENSLTRWAVEMQNDFKARLDWCVTGYAEANHPPAVKLKGELQGEVPYSDGLIRIAGERKGSRLAAVAAEAKRGDSFLTLNATARVRVGQTIRLKMVNPADNSLGRHLYGEQGALNPERQKWYGGQIVDWAVRVKSIEGPRIELERPLRTDVRPEWNPEIWSFEPTVQESGIEELTLEFPTVPYGGHHKEAGYYGIHLNNVVQCWVRNVSMVDTDFGVYFSGCGWNTVTGITLKASVRREANDSVDHATGHYGFRFAGVGTQDNLVTNSRLLTTFVHNFSCSSFANGNVYSGLTATSARFDQHAGAPYENLYTDIDIRGKASDLFMCGGNRADEPNAGARTTFWNVRVEQGGFPGRIPALKDGTPRFPLINIIGLEMMATTHTAAGLWIDRWPGGTTDPPDLYRAQLDRRLSGVRKTGK